MILSRCILKTMLAGSAALIALAACAEPAGPAPQPADTVNAMDTLPVEKRVAFMSGHVEAGLALYRAGEPDLAAPHLMHPVSETHQAERAGIEALGFEQAHFIRVSEALENGQPAAQVEPLLEAAETNMAHVRGNAGGEPVEIIAYLMDVIDEEYAIGVSDGVITDAGEYYDAYGFTVVALDIAQGGDLGDGAVTRLNALLALWPQIGPVEAVEPAAAPVVLDHTDRVRAALR